MQVLRWGLIALVPIAMIGFGAWLLVGQGSEDGERAAGLVDSDPSPDGAERGGGVGAAAGGGEAERGVRGDLSVDRSEDRTAVTGADAPVDEDSRPSEGLREVVGRVVDEDGRPLADVEVQPYVRWSPDREIDSVRSADDGRFRMRLDSSEGELWLRVKPERRVWTQVPIPSGGTGERANVGDIVCELGATLVGRVVDLDGRPVREAEVSAWSRKNSSDTEQIFFGIASGAGVIRSTLTDRAGRFEIVGLGEGMGSVRAVAPGLQPATVKDIVLIVAETAEGVLLTLEPGLSVTGIVVDAAGRPVSGAKVGSQFTEWNVEDMMSQARPPETVSGEDGRFELSSLSERPLHIDVTFAGHLPARREQVQPPADLRIELRAASAVVGRVIAAEGQPLADFDLDVSQPRGGPGGSEDEGPTVLLAADAAPHLPADTDSTGCFAILDARSKNLWITVRAEGYARARVGPLSTAPEDASFVEVSMQAAVGLRGVVRGPEGQPIAGAKVRLTRPRQGRGGSEVIALAAWEPAERNAPETSTSYDIARGDEKTDEEGRYHLAGVPPGTYELRASHDSWVESEPQEVVFEAGEPSPGPIDIELRAGGTLIGRTFDAEGAPLAGAKVQVNRAQSGSGGSREDYVVFGVANAHRSATSDGEGNYVIEGLAPGEYRAEVDKAQGGGGSRIVAYLPNLAQAPEGVPFSVGVGEVVELDLRLEPRARLQVRVSDGRRGIPGARVKILREGRPNFDPFGNAPMTDDEGFCSFDGLSEGELTLAVDPPGGAPGVRQSHRVVGGAEDSVTVVLPGAVVSGRVADAAGVGVEGVSVRLRSKGEDAATMLRGVFMVEAGGNAEFGRSRTGADGRFTIPYVQEGEFSLEVSDDTILRVDAVDVTVASGKEPEPIQVEVARAGALEVQMVGAEQGRSTLTLTSFERSDDVLHKRPWGGRKVRFTGVPPGRYDLRIESGAKNWSGTVDVVAGENQVTAELR